MAPSTLLRRSKKPARDRDPREKIPLQKNRSKRLTVALYLLQRLSHAGITHFYSTAHPHLECLQECAKNRTKISYVESPCGYLLTNLADGYAKAAGFGALALTKKTPGLIEAVIRASHESVAEVFILGTEGVHVSHPFDEQDYIEKGLRKLTVGWTILDDAKVAAKKIDRIIDYCLYYQKPVCIELAQEIADVVIAPHERQKTDFPHCDLNSLHDFLLDLDELLTKAKQPTIHYGRHITAHHLQEELELFKKRFNIANYSPEITTDLLIVFGDTLPCHTPTQHIVRIGIETAYCDERRYSNLYFTTVVEALSSLECRKYFKTPKEKHQDVPTNISCLITLIKKLGCRVVTSNTLSGYFSKKCDLLTTQSETTLSYSVEASIGAKNAHSHKKLITVVTETELQHSLPTLQMAQQNSVSLVICVLPDSIQDIANSYSWNLTELAHLFVDGNAIEVHTMKTLEKALCLALEANEGLFLITSRS